MQTAKITRLLLGRRAFSQEHVLRGGVRLARTGGLAKVGRRQLSTGKAHSAQRERVAVIGSGNWGSVAARIAAQNVLKQPNTFEPEVKMWVFEEPHSVHEDLIHKVFNKLDVEQTGTINVHDLEEVSREVGISLSRADAEHIIRELDFKQLGEISFSEFKHWWTHKGKTKYQTKLTDIINRTKENVKYLPGVSLGTNVHAEPNLLSAIHGATVLVVVTPHQFIKNIVQQVKGKLHPRARAISLVKGMDVTPDGFQLISNIVSSSLGIDCSVLMGANIANEIAQEQFSEATVGYREPANGELFVNLFNTPYFLVRAVQDVEGAELCGTLKNIVALGAGFVDGLQLGNNSKAAIIRIGLMEMKKLSQLLYPTVRDETFFESCGVADLITTCYGGRNRKCAEAFVRAGGKKSFAQLEQELLAGQKLQGVLTSMEVQEILHRKGLEAEFPLFTTINRICRQQIPPHKLVDYHSLPQ